MSTVFTVQICLLIGLQTVISSAKIHEKTQVEELFEQTRKPHVSMKSINLNYKQINDDYPSILRKLNVSNQKHLFSNLKRYKRTPQDDIPPYVGKGRIKPFRSFVTPETTTQTGINKRMPKYFLSLNSSTSNSGDSNNNYRNKKKENKINARNGNSAIALFSKSKNLTAELLSNKNKQSVATVSPRPIVSGGKTKKRVLKGNARPRKPGTRFNRNNVARGKIKKVRKSSRATTPFPIYSTTFNSEASS